MDKALKQLHNLFLSFQYYSLPFVITLLEQKGWESMYLVFIPLCI